MEFIDTVIALVCSKFKHVGGGTKRPGSLMAATFQDGPPLFALGVPVKDVVSTVFTAYDEAVRPQFERLSMAVKAMNGRAIIRHEKHGNKTITKSIGLLSQTEEEVKAFIFWLVQKEVQASDHVKPNEAGGYDIMNANGIIWISYQQFDGYAMEVPEQL